MLYRIVLAGLAIPLLLLVGCRTGEYRVDLEIYEAMPALLEADPELSRRIFRNEDGSLKVRFEKGEMHLNFAYGLDPGTRMDAASQALQIFRDQYVNHPDNLKGDGAYRRQLIGIRGFIDDTELYVVEWYLNEDHPNLLDNRDGSYI